MDIEDAMASKLKDQWKELSELKKSVKEDLLDEEILAIFERKASDVNNEGVTAQVDAMLEIYGLEDTIKAIKELLG